MFYCKKCGDERGWPDGLAKSTGSCEVCERRAVCSDGPSKNLPKPKPEPKTPTIEKAEVARTHATLTLSNGVALVISLIRDKVHVGFANVTYEGVRPEQIQANGVDLHYAARE